MNIRHSFLIIAIAFGAGILYTLWQQNDLPTLQHSVPPPPEPTESLESPIFTPDSFTHKLLQATLQHSEGNIILAPRALAANLHILSQYSSDATLSELQSLGLTATQYAPNDTPGEAALLFADYNTAFDTNIDANTITPVPLSGDIGHSIPLINNIVAQAIGADDFNLLHGDHLATASRLISTISLNVHTTWLYAMHASSTPTYDFFNANGSIPRVRAISCEGDIRVAKAPNAEWLAFALQTEEKKGDYLIIIVPQQISARQFAKGMDAKQLADIRQALAQNTPEHHNIEMPRLVFHSPTQELLPVLQLMGISRLISPQANLKGITAETPFYLQAALQKCHISFTENTSELPKSSAPDISVNKPFIWILGSLHNSTPPGAMGIIENL